MGVFSPYALQAGFEGDDLATQLRTRKLAAAKAQMEMDEARKQQAARALLGQVLQGMGIGQGGIQGPNMIPQSPAPGQSSVPMQRPGGFAPMRFGGDQPTGPVSMPVQSGGAPGGAAPIQPGAGATSMPGGPPAQPGGGMAPGAGTAAPQQTPFSWRQVMDQVRQRTDAPPDVIFAAMQEVMPQLDKEDQRAFLREQQDARLDQKREAERQMLAWRYANTDSQLEKTQIMARMKQLTTEMQTNAQRDVANINAASRNYATDVGANTKLTLADKNNLARAAIADATNRSKEKIAADALAWKKEYGDAFLDMKSDEIGKSFIVKSRALDLQQQGLDQKDAQFTATLEANQAKWAAQNEIALRGQDLAHEDRVAAETGRNARNTANLDAKTLIQRGKDAKIVDDAGNRLDDMSTSINHLLAMPGFDDAFGPRSGRIPDIMRGDDVVAARAALDSLAAEKGLAVIAAMRASSATGGSGFSRITNFELQQFQNSIRSLKSTQDPETLRENLMYMRDWINTQKLRMAQGYEKQYAPQAGRGPVPAGGPAPGGKTIAIPAEVPKGARKQVNGKWYESQGDGTAIEVR